MHVVFERADDARLIAHLREAEVTTQVIGWNPERCVQHLLAALEGAELEGYGECFWPEPTGQYWWMFKREDQRLEVAVLWSRSSAGGWQHVFRATDEISYIADLIRAQLRARGL